MAFLTSPKNTLAMPGHRAEMVNRRYVVREFRITDKVVAKAVKEIQEQLKENKSQKLVDHALQQEFWPDVLKKFYGKEVQNEVDRINQELYDRLEFMMDNPLENTEEQDIALAVLGLEQSKVEENVYRQFTQNLFYDHVAKI